ncbi:uncharacterized protein METZ01_LOCUS179603, partial [marine metagenome]
VTNATALTTTTTSRLLGNSKNLPITRTKKRPYP